MRLTTVLALAAALASCKPGTGTGTDTDTDTDTDTGTGTDTDIYAWDLTFWGDAPGDLDKRLAVFDDLWTDYAENYGAFVAAEGDWDVIGQETRPRVEAAETYGEFLRHITHMFDDVREGHSWLFSETICNSPLSDRPPVMWWANMLPSRQTSGVCATGTADGAALIYRVDPDNPAGLRPGDEILGYDDRPWSELLAEAEEMPICCIHAGSRQAEDHIKISSAPMNAHLFETMDVRRGDTGEVESIETEDLLGYEFPELLCTEQVGVDIEPPWSTWGDYHRYETPITWGVLPDTNIGFIYLYGWVDDVEEAFLGAVVDLYDTDGLIIDTRFNVGGNMFLAFDALAVLFDEDLEGVIAIGLRSDPDDYEALDILREPYDVPVDPSTYYDHPIAILTGPMAVSSGDNVAWYLAQHPRAQRFGLPTNGSGCYDPSSGWLWDARDPHIGDLQVKRTTCVALDDEDVAIALGAVDPEVEVWLTPQDVLAGRDTVVEAALAWVLAGGD